MTKRADFSLKTSVSYKLVHLAVNAKKWCGQCKNDKTFWATFYICTVICVAQNMAEKLQIFWKLKKQTVTRVD